MTLQRIALTMAMLACTHGIPGANAALITEEVPVTADSKPFFAAATELTAHGFREDEYFVAGTANVYEYDAANQLQVQTADVPFKTRLLIRRPASPARFNGFVLFELLNPTARHDIDFAWHFNRRLLLSRGYIWVGMTMQDVAIEALDNWDGERYGSLHMSDRGLVYEMFAQVGALLRDPADPANPLADYGVDYIIGTGYSQSADYLTTFSNEFHEHALAWDGRHAFDGYLHTGGSGAARRINSADPEELYTDERRFNRVQAPLIRVQSESEVAIFLYPSSESRQPDSDVFRVYEIAGGSHADEEELLNTGEVIARDLGLPVLPDCEAPLSPVHISPVHRSSLHNLSRWIRDGVPPPPSQLIELAGLRDVIRDELGNALGGVRLPPLEAPYGNYTPGNVGPPPCPLAGSFFAFDEATLDALYPTHGRYVRQVKRAARRAVKKGYLLPADAARYVIEAAQSSIGH